MSHFSLYISTDNAAFRDDNEALTTEAIMGILADVAHRIDGFTADPGESHEFLIRDSNGNQVGSAFIEED